MDTPKLIYTIKMPVLLIRAYNLFGIMIIAYFNKKVNIIRKVSLFSAKEIEIKPTA